MLIDTHCHLNDAEAFPDPRAAIEEAQAAGVERLIVVGIDLESSLRAVELAEAFDGVYATVGWHPNYAHEFDGRALLDIEALLSHPRVVALGEIGLDYHWDFATPEQQERCLLAQLELVTDLPVVLHCRKAYPALLDVLERQQPRRWVFHCFSGDGVDASRSKRLGGWFGVDGPITYKKSEVLRALVRNLPTDHLLIETDSPYMTPHPHRSERNRPALLPLINRGLAEALEVTAEECAALTTRNAMDLFFKAPVD